MSDVTRAFAGTTLACALLATPPALAHVSLDPGKASANATTKIVLGIPHGCDGAPTTGLTVRIPEGFASVKPMPKPGWTLATPEGADDVREIHWSGGSLPDAHFDEFAFRGRVGDLAAGTVLPFAVIQTCGTGETAWTEIAQPGADPHDLAHPAPTLTVTAADTSGHGAHHGAAAAATITIDTAWMRQPPPGAAVAGAYVTITNTGAQADRLVGGSAPFAGRFEVHEMRTENGMMHMQEVEGGLEIPAGATVALAPGSYHIMLMDLSEVPTNGTTVPMSLTFENAGTVDVVVDVAPMGATSAPDGHAGHGAMKHGSN